MPKARKYTIGNNENFDRYVIRDSNGIEIAVSLDKSKLALRQIDQLIEQANAYAEEREKDGE